jgi:predicted Zn-dependent protease
MTEQTPDRKKILQKILILFSAVAFGGSTIFALGGLFTQGNQPSSVKNSQSQSTPAVEQQLQQLKVQESGYRKVLEREPNNPAALQGLAQIRLQLNDLAGAIDPLEKLVKLYPQEENLQVLLSEVKKRVDEGNTATTKPKNPESKP